MARTSENELDKAGLIIKSAIERSCMTQSEVAKKAGIGAGTVSHIINGTRRSFSAVNKLLNALNLSYDDIFLESSPCESHDDSLPPTRGSKVIGEIAPEDLRLLTEWVMTQDEPARMAANIRFMVETRYADFEEWIKKHERSGKSGTPAGSKSEINGD